MVNHDVRRLTPRQLVDIVSIEKAKHQFAASLHHQYVQLLIQCVIHLAFLGLLGREHGRIDVAQGVTALLGLLFGGVVLLSVARSAFGPHR